MDTWGDYPGPMRDHPIVRRVRGLLPRSPKICEAPAAMNPPQKSWMDLVLPPERYEPIEVRLSDNSVKRGIWTGAQWWAEGQQILPKAWRPFRSAFQFEGASQLRSA